MLDVFFSLDGVPWIFVFFEVNQILHVVSLGEASDGSLFVFVDSTNENE